MSQKFLIHGTVLFLLGLMNGAVIPLFFNTRMGLSAHLAAVQNALVLWALGLMWARIHLRPTLLTLTARLALVGLYGIWLAIVAAGITGANQSLPIAGAGFGASAMVETLITVVLYLSSTALIAAMGLVLWGLMRGRHTAPAS